MAEHLALLLTLPSHSSPIASPSKYSIPTKSMAATGRPNSCGSNRRFSASSTPKCLASDPEQLKSAREDIKQLLKTTFCHPILVRLGWHDAGTYNKNIEEWPQRGGANGSLRFDVELGHGANAGLINALKLIEPIKKKYSNITYADLFQLASATAIEEAGGPKIPMKYGRVDVVGPEQCPEEGRLPDAGPPSPASHLRDVFYRMGLNDKEIVALSGAHTLGRARPERSGWGKPETKYTKDGPGAPGGQSWTVQWLKFDNSYFKDIKEKIDEELLVLPTDAVLFEDPSFKVYAEKYLQDQESFFKDYAEAHAKLSNLGAKFDPPEGIVLDASPKPAGEKFDAAKYSYGKRELSDSMKQKIRAEYEAFGGSPDKALPTNYFLNIILVIAVLAILTSLLGN
ncbi:putative L-ascorbate peroxidase 6 [Cucumis melo var. makuwa]|uniref:L-ascorbate peroxidase n=1 Tax=Cucumis melo var. makuwa TaxID=1194695 RepID=A0A5D3CCG6_CUCMM|nr:putative L-ascorbate peroxidase 6 [Cucumis melo var. makuwa]TYK08924.1 putative L-ascorbate peroxidase 6 [Cucumis melo var. makuwa]